jgi:hypothetical protein
VTPDEAEEYTQSLAQIMGGGWRQVLWAQQQGIPKALGLSTEDWVARLGGYIKLSVPERREAHKELTRPRDEGGAGLTQREAAEVTGADQATVSRDLKPDADASPEPEPEAEPQVNGEPPLKPDADASPEPEAVPRPELSPAEQQAKEDGKAEREEQARQAELQRQRRVATHQLCQHVVAVAQMNGMDIGSRYDPAEVLPGRAITTDILSDARDVLDQLLKMWEEGT